MFFLIILVLVFGFGAVLVLPGLVAILISLYYFLIYVPYQWLVVETGACEPVKVAISDPEAERIAAKLGLSPDDAYVQYLIRTR